MYAVLYIWQYMQIWRGINSTKMFAYHQQSHKKEGSDIMSGKLPVYYLDSGFWTLDSRLWILDSGLWILDSGLDSAWVLDWTLYVISVLGFEDILSLILSLELLKLSFLVALYACS